MVSHMHKRWSELRVMFWRRSSCVKILVLKIHCNTGSVLCECRQCRDANAYFVSIFTASFSLHVWKTSQGVCVKSLAHQSFPAIHSFACLLSWKHYFYLLFKNENIVSTVKSCCGNNFKCLAILRYWDMCENNFSIWFIPLASDTSFPLVMVQVCGVTGRRLQFSTELVL